MKEFIRNCTKLIRKLSKDFYKDPIFFTSLLPSVVALWPLLSSLFIYQPRKKPGNAKRYDFTRAELAVDGNSRA